MKKIFYLLLSCILFSEYLFAQHENDNYEIEVIIKPFKNEWVYLTNYFVNTTKYLIDSARVDNNSRAIFKGSNSAINGGVYALVFPGKKSYIDFIIDQNRIFSIYVDTVHLDNIQFKNSTENEDFYRYQKFVADTKKKYDLLFSEIKMEHKPDSIAIYQQLNTDQLNTIKAYKSYYIKEHPNSLLSTLFLIMDGPSIPRFENKIDSFEYFSNHYWDNIPLSDPKVLRTPILEQKLFNYINNLIVNNTDSMKNAAFRIIDAAKKDTATYRYFLSTLAVQYGNSKIPTQSDAFAYIFNKYIENQRPSWLPENLYHQMERRSNFIAGNIIGNKAYDFNLIDTSGKIFNLYNIKTQYTVLCFWDPTCGHCLKIVPIVDSLYQTKWSKKNIALIGVYVDGGEQNWKNYIEARLKGWIHGYETETMRKLLYEKQIPNFRQLYDIQETPVLYLLDRDKKIILKKVSPEFLDSYISYLEALDKKK